MITVPNNILLILLYRERITTPESRGEKCANVGRVTFVRVFNGFPNVTVRRYIGLVVMRKVSAHFLTFHHYVHFVSRYPMTHHDKTQLVIKGTIRVFYPLYNFFISQVVFQRDVSFRGDQGFKAGYPGTPTTGVLATSRKGETKREGMRLPRGETLGDLIVDKFELTWLSARRPHFFHVCSHYYLQYTTFTRTTRR